MRIPKALTTTFYTLCGISAIAIAAVLIADKPLPKGLEGSEAEALTDSMMAAANCETWERLRFVAWNYDNRRQYVWDKYYHLAEVCYGDIRVLLNLDAVDGIVWKGGERLSLYEKRRYIASAWKHWCNDSFWLNPVCKLRDDGTVRKLVTQKDSSRALLVTYRQGGVTPGDSFLWITDAQYRPVAWRMWVHMLPVSGLKATWEAWTSVADCQISTQHHIGPYQIDILDLHIGSHHSELGLQRDPFEDFVTE